MKRLDPTDSNAYAQWLAAVKQAVTDLETVAEDAIQPIGARRLGRVEHRRLFVEASEQLRDLLAYATPENGTE